MMATAITNVLITHHYLINIATSGQTGLELANAYAYDLIILDVMLPDLDGISLCRQLRTQGFSTPILLLTAKASTTDRVIGLNAGADDYLVKPVDFDELLARVRALLRRQTAVMSFTITYGDLCLNADANEFTYKGNLLRLTPKEYLLLELFIRNPRRVFSRGVILDRLWAVDEFPNEETITAHIKSLRQRLKAVGAPTGMIETVYGVGYRLQALSASEAPPSMSSISRSSISPSSISPTPTPSGDMSTSATHPVTHPATHPVTQDHAYQPASEAPFRQQQATAAVDQLRKKFKATFLAQVKVLEQGAIAITRDSSTSEHISKNASEQVSDHLKEHISEHLTTIQSIAHKLAGSLGTFGYKQGSRYAQEIERLLQADSLSDTPKEQLLTLVKLLRQELENPPSNSHPESIPNRIVPTPEQPSPTSKPPHPPQLHVLLIDDDDILTEHIQHDAIAWNWRVQVAPSPTIARSFMAETLPDVILLDLTFPDSNDDGLALLKHLTHQAPTIPVIVFTGRGSLSDRMEAARLGSRAFLQKPISTEQIFTVVNQIINPLHPHDAKIMVMDDDLVVLDLIRTLLQPWGLATIPVSNPEQFWEALETTMPDVLILDIEMPKINGIDLCQVVRNDPRWAELPILMLSAHTDTETRQQVFTVGADDFLQKPIVEPELVARIINRLERSQIYRKLAQRATLQHPSQLHSSTPNFSEDIHDSRDRSKG